MSGSLVRAMLGGLVGTTAMTAVLYSAPRFGMAKPDIISWLGTPGSSKGSPENSPPWYTGLAAHALVGVVVFPLAYKLFFSDRMKGPNWMRGVEYSMLLWLFANAIAYPTAGEGLFFTAHWNSASISTVMLMGHVVYGAILGAIAESGT